VSCSFGESIQIIGLIKHSHAAGDNFSVAKKRKKKSLSACYKLGTFHAWSGFRSISWKLFAIKIQCQENLHFARLLSMRPQRGLLEIAVCLFIKIAHALFSCCISCSVFGAAEMCMQHLHYAIEHKTPLSICRRLVLLATKSSRRPFSSGVFCAIEAMRLGPRLGASRSANSSCGGGSTNHAAARRIICANE
jgi:hypothetical protein